MRLGRKGQGLIEAVLCLPLCLALVVGVTALLYQHVVYFLADYHAHEALICMQDQSPSVCRHELEDRLWKILFKNSQLKVLCNKNSIQAEVQLRFRIQLEFQSWNVPVEIKKSMRSL